MKMLFTFYLLFLIVPQLVFGQKVSIISTELHRYPNIRDFCLSADGKEAYFTIQSPNQELSQIVMVKNNRWKKPMLLPFCDEYSYLEAFLSKDGKRLYFASNRPKNASNTTNNDYDIWYVERANTQSEWSEPINLGPQVNSENDEFYPTLAANGNLYFTMDAKSGLGKDDIYFCKWEGNAYSKPVLLNNNINSEGYEFNAFIAEDERFIIYTKYNAKDGFGSGDLYASAKTHSGEWGVPINLGNDINSKQMEYCPFYDSRTNTLYFTSRRSNLMPEKFKNTRQYLERISGSENGLSKIYQYKIKL